MRSILCFTLCALVCPGTAVAQLRGCLPKAAIFPQPDAPLQITRFFSSCGRAYPLVRPTGEAEGIYHTAEYRNVSDRSIVAVRLGLATFDQWRELLGGIDGVAVMPLEPGGSRMRTWVDPLSAELVAPATFAYVSKVRFGDGEVWSADLDRVLEQLQASGWGVPSLSFYLCKPESGFPRAADAAAGEQRPGESPEQLTADDDFLDVDEFLDVDSWLPEQDEDEPPR